jgi:hypothetical protein
MERQSVQLLRLFGKILGVTAVISLAVLLLGYFLKWNTPVQYSNAFFWAGAIVAVMGVLSVTGGFTQRANFQITYAETASAANIAERNQRMAADITQRYGTLILLTVPGVLLIAVAVAIGQIFV